jgi:hypothetical protein
MAGLSASGRYRGLGEAQIRSEVLKDLRAAGLTPSSIEVSQLPDGGLRIEVSGSMGIEIDNGHLQEALEDLGLSREVLGDDASSQLEALEAR